MVARRLIPQLARRMAARTTPVAPQTSSALLNRYAPASIPNLNRRCFSAQAAHMHSQSERESDQSSNSSSKSSAERSQDRAPEREATKESAKEEAKEAAAEGAKAEKSDKKVEKEAPKAENAEEPIPPQTPEEEALAEGIRKQIAEASDKVKMLQERLLETHKDAEIMRTRHKREMDNSHKYGVTKFAKELLEVADNLQRAQEAVAADALKAGGTLKSLHDGVGMTCKTLQKVDEKFKKLMPES
jgi:molecular chaperone GrpE (heat shock protein)